MPTHPTLSPGPPPNIAHLIGNHCLPRAVMNITDPVDERGYTDFVECLKTSPDTFVLAKLAVI